ncbi:hypothetical protein Y032_0239g3318 [Ancylostoma ceylanicum]|uniref:Uncharacterized protein n=1 Tax=Ancylostoma ceylanicum TaxID=53326 RepID=A0A016SEX0_9BILA|nr:hypothetical protein Y032_0239g3318 [Ancylostoma ceylanicum]
MMLVTPVMATPMAAPPPPAVAYSHNPPPSNAPLPRVDKPEDIGSLSNSPRSESRKSNSKEPVEPTHVNQVRPTSSAAVPVLATPS